jgi:tRNA-splicing endonuclease subunit Sen34
VGDPMQCDAPPDEEYDEFYAAYYGLEAPPAQQQQQQQQQQEQPIQPPQQQPTVTQAQPAAVEQQQQQQQQQPEPQPWQLWLKANSRVAVPLTAADSAATMADIASSHSSSSGAAKQHAAAAAGVTAGRPKQQQEAPQQQQGPSTSRSSGSPYRSCQPVSWQYPCTPVQWLRLAVFADLHSRGFSVTGGAKFGGDFLAYPGDPHLYHAQFVVRVVLPDQVLNPSVLQGLARGVHAARKHLVLATVQPGCALPAAAAAAAAAGGAMDVGVDGQTGCSEGSVAAAAASTAAAVGSMKVSTGLGVGGRGLEGIAATAGAVAAAATNAACRALFGGAAQIGPVQLGGGSGSIGVLRYLTIARETGWSAE